MDEENYDDDDDEEGDDEKDEEYKDTDDTNKAPTLPASNEKRRGRHRKKLLPATPALDYSIYSEIPLGKQGARMLITFGDGPTPHPETVAACLLGARRMLQVAMQDARYIRHKYMIELEKNAEALESTASLTQAYQTTLNTPADGRVYRRRKDNGPQCGFDRDDLIKLYPEEMSAFRRWTRMQEEYQEYNKQDKVDLDDPTAAVESKNDEEDDIDDVNDPRTQDAAGHLTERLAMFDVRTTHMKDDWYLQFADVRQGSFLPQRDFATAEGKAWKEHQDTNKVTARGRPKLNQERPWVNVSMVVARFLHWLGLDTAALSPPTAETIMALGYLGYDFFGRIVERAIFLKPKQPKKRRKLDELLDDCDTELSEGQQLDEADIQRAIEDLNPVPLYTAASDARLKKTVDTQLYFGPGFEDRLEMEMEEMLAGMQADKNAVLSTEDVKFRQEEDSLFAKMSQPPIRDAIGSLLEDHAERERAKDSKAGAETEVDE
jgi:hypothetical protein